MIPHSLRQAVRLVAILNLAYFGIECAVALSFGSVSLFADSIYFLEDASVNFLVMALAWSARARARVGKLLAAICWSPVWRPCGWPGTNSCCLFRPRRCR